MDQRIYPFEVGSDELQKHIDDYVNATFSTLSSFYLEMPRGENYVEYSRFEDAYETLRASTRDFQSLDPESVRQAVRKDALVLVVLRCIVGLSPPELADLAAATQGIEIDQGFARAIDQRARGGKDLYARARPDSQKRLDALVDTVCAVLQKGPTKTSEVLIHRLDKVDTAEGLKSLHQVATQGVPYQALLHERLLGRPFASHRDSVSEMIGDIIESAVVAELTAAGVPFHKTGRAEKIPSFDQAPDFLIPDINDPRVVIEAKLTQDDGTARDKITRVQHLDRLSESGKRFEVIACIDGRGFKIRREDMKKLLLATRGKVFSVATLPRLVEQSGLKRFASAPPRGGREG